MIKKYLAYAILFFLSVSVTVAVADTWYPTPSGGNTVLRPALGTWGVKIVSSNLIDFNGNKYTTSTGSGNGTNGVSTSGSPLANYISFFVDPNTITGVSNLNYATNTALFTVTATSSFQSVSSTNFGASGNGYFVGNLSVGTSSAPEGLLVLDGGGSEYIRSGGSLVFRPTVNNYNYTVSSLLDNGLVNLEIQEGVSGTRLTLQQGGSLGVDTTQPSSTLHVISNAVGTPSFQVSGFKNQTANLLTINSSTGQVYFSISPLGLASSSEFRANSSTIGTLQVLNTLTDFNGNKYSTSTGGGSSVQALPTSTVWIDTQLLFGELGGFATSSASLTFSTSSGVFTVASSSLTNVSSSVLTVANNASVGSLYINGVNFTSLQGSGLTVSGNALTCATANGSTFGCLTSANWTTFNSKQAALNVVDGQIAFGILGTNVSSSAMLSFASSTGVLTVTATSSFTNVSSTNQSLTGFLNLSTNCNAGDFLTQNSGGNVKCGTPSGSGFSGGVDTQVLFGQLGGNGTSSQLLTYSSSTGSFTIGTSTATSNAFLTIASTSQIFNVNSSGQIYSNTSTVLPSSTIFEFTAPTSTVHQRGIMMNNSGYIGIGTLSPYSAISLSTSTGLVTDGICWSPTGCVYSSAVSQVDISGTLKLHSSLDFNGGGILNPSNNSYNWPNVSSTRIDATSRISTLALFASATSTVGTSTETIGNNVMFAVASSTPILYAFSNGTVTVGTSSPSFTYKLVTQGKVQMAGLTSSGVAQTDSICADAQGQLILDTATCIASAAKFKKDIQPLNVGLDELLRLRPVQYYLKHPIVPINESTQQVGFIADEAQLVDPRLVTLDSTGAVHGFRYEQFTAVITSAVQEFYRQFQSLVARVSGLESRMNAQQTEIDSLQQQINQLKSK